MKIDKDTIIDSLLEERKVLLPYFCKQAEACEYCANKKTALPCKDSKETDCKACQTPCCLLTCSNGSEFRFDPTTPASQKAIKKWEENHKPKPANKVVVIKDLQKALRCDRRENRHCTRCKYAVYDSGCGEHYCNEEEIRKDAADLVDALLAEIDTKDARIKELSQRKPREAFWEYDDFDDIYTCAACHTTKTEPWNFCPICGAKMKGIKKEDDHG